MANNAEYPLERVAGSFRLMLGGEISPPSGRVMALFREIVYGHFRKYRRSFPWRETADPYRILVSEIMLQQTQTERVAPKYVEFVRAFPTPESLASADLRQVLSLWQGLGYNRRARMLHELARTVTAEYGGDIPADPALLAELPGIGPATAASICAFAFNMPLVFIETNIRAVFIHFFFDGRASVRDGEILPLAELALDRADPRSWYSALMDFGVMVKRRVPNPGRKSAHYQRQSPFGGSRRQLRGRVIRALLEGDNDAPGLARLLETPLAGVRDVLDDLVREGLVREEGSRYRT